MTTKRYDSLDGLRALACIGIILMHVQSNITVKPSENFLTTNIFTALLDSCIWKSMLPTMMLYTLYIVD